LFNKFHKLSQAEYHEDQNTGVKRYQEVILNNIFPDKLAKIQMEIQMEGIHFAILFYIIA
jgi:hypothetical protein